MIVDTVWKDIENTVSIPYFRQEVTGKRENTECGSLELNYQGRFVFG